MFAHLLPPQFLYKNERKSAKRPSTLIRAGWKVKLLISFRIQFDSILTTSSNVDFIDSQTHFETKLCMTQLISNSSLSSANLLIWLFHHSALNNTKLIFGKNLLRYSLLSPEYIFSFIYEPKKNDKLEEKFSLEPFKPKPRP